MPSKKKKKKSKAKGRRPATGKGGANKAADNASVNEVQKKGTLSSEMQRLKIDEDALLEEAIKLAAVEEQEMKEKEKENCSHGYNPSSRFQARFCEDFMKIFMESFYSARRGNKPLERLSSVNAAFSTAIDRSHSANTTNISRNRSNFECVNPFCLAEGTKNILDGKSDDARVCAVLALYMNFTDCTADEFPDLQKMLELIDGDEHTLVQFFRKQIPCSCLDEKYKEVKSITKMGVCYNEECPLPDRRAIHSSMLQCTGCLDISYCSRECQEADWPKHKIVCGKTSQEVAQSVRWEIMRRSK